MRKKAGLVFVSILLIVTIIALGVVSSLASTIYVYNGYSYTDLGDNKVSICDWDDSSETFVVPEMLLSDYVSSIGGMALMDDQVITSVDFSSAYYLTSIGIMAFKGCSNISGTIALPSGLDSIGLGAFQDCSSIESMNFNSSNANIPNQFCYGCTSLQNVVIADGVQSIGSYAFANCGALSYVRIPASVSSIDSTAFLNCTNAVIYCYSGSYAQQFAEDNIIDYVVIDTPDFAFTSHSISLNGDIVLNFYVKVPEDYVNAERARVDFSWQVDGVNKTESVTLSSVEKSIYGYKASCPVAVAEMTYDVTAKVLVDGIERGVPDTYSVQTYANRILTDAAFASRFVAAENEIGNNGSERLDQLQTLVKTMLDYGSKSQIRFDRKTDDLANGGEDYFTGEVSIPSYASDMEENLADCGLQYVGTSVIYLTQTTLRHYYYIKDPSKFTTEIQNSITFDGLPVSYGTRDNLIYFDKPDIVASQIDTEYILNINGFDYQYSALDYSELSYRSDNLPYNESISKQLAASVYRYNKAANTYFND